jgi:formate dehydrogenase gamma subunit
MTTKSIGKVEAKKEVHTLRTFKRFTLAQRWEHMILLLSVTVLLLTGLPQRYRTATWSQQILSTPERVETVQQIHHIAAVVLTLEVVYHLGNALVLLFRRKLPGDMLPTWRDIRDAWQMILYLLFLRKDKPPFGKYNFEQKFTYWFLFFGIGVMVTTGFIIWFPELFTKILPGGIVPASKMAHSTEAVVAAIFVVIWHFYHVHLERLNLSIFTGWLNEKDMRVYHELDYKNHVNNHEENPRSGDSHQ